MMYRCRVSHSNLPMNQVSSCRYSLHEKAHLKILNQELHSARVVQNPKSVPFLALQLSFLPQLILVTWMRRRQLLHIQPSVSYSLCILLLIKVLYKNNIDSQYIKKQF